MLSTKGWRGFRFLFQVNRNQNKLLFAEQNQLIKQVELSEASDWPQTFPLRITLTQQYGMYSTVQYFPVHVIAKHFLLTLVTMI